MSNLVKNKDADRFVIRNEERSEWCCHLFYHSSGVEGITYQPIKGNEPNWFWRLMQRLILGFKWERKS